MVKLGSMLIVPEDESVKHSEKIRGKENESSEDGKKKARLLSQQDPMDWILKNEHVSSMISVSSAKAFLKPFNCFALKLENKYA